MSVEDERGSGLLEHGALARRCAGVPLARAGLTDKQRFALLFQGAALLAHLRALGLAISSWEGARVGEDGELRVERSATCRSMELPQVVLVRLLRVVFGEPTGTVGRGEARRAARYFKARWQQTLAPVNLDVVVSELLEQGVFLWSSRFAAARTALAGSHREAAGTKPWLIGPGGARRRFLALADSRRELERLLRSAAARDLWEGWSPELDGAALARSGRWRKAIVAWRRNPPCDGEELVGFARCLFAFGKYSQALRILRGRRDIPARILRCSCQLGLGQLKPAAHTLRQIEHDIPTARELIEVGEVAVRVWALLGRRDRVRDWVAMVLRAGRGRLRGAAALIAAGGAWDLDELDRMEVFLEKVSELARGDQKLLGRYHRMRALRAIARGDGLAVVEHLTASFALDRRRLMPTDAGRMWNDLAVGRALAGDLPAAEKACRHALRLLREAEGPSPTTLALYNLAEVRLRRGRISGVEKILSRSTAENRRSANLPGLIRDLELWVRVELVRGNALAALGRCAEAMHELDERGVDGRREVFYVFMARANGWLGRRQAARELLASVGEEALAELEIEERPAVWALAGSLERAADVAAGTPWSELWSSFVSNRDPSDRAWTALRGLEPFRAARLVLDCELARSGSVPEVWAHKALRFFRRADSAFADKLEATMSSPWRALRSYLGKARGNGEAISELFAAAGYGEAKLTWSRGDRKEILIDGAGGCDEVVVDVAKGRLVLRCSRVDKVLESLLALVTSDLAPVLAEQRRERTVEAPDSDMIGDSEALRAALSRLDRLAGGELPILILGETGTGKELAARRAHSASVRRRGSFLALNCAALPESLIQSELFGHVRGAFTGAARDRPGVFEAACGGTVFLDEIGDLPLLAQGQLLRALQEKEIRRVGESFSRRVDVRIIAATHRDLEQMVRDGEFRRDLYFRLKVARIVLPPLRDRGEDVLVLAEHFLGTGGTRLAVGARQRLLSHHWPGNVRELENVIAVGSALAGADPIEPRHLDIELEERQEIGSYHRQVRDLKRKLVSEALRSSGGNRARAARQLGISRQALSYLVRQLDLLASAAPSGSKRSRI